MQRARQDDVGRAAAATKRWTEALARTVLADAERSGERLMAYANRLGIDPQRLYWWKRELEGRAERAGLAATRGFLPVRVAPDVRATPSSTRNDTRPGFEVELPGGCVVRLAVDFDAKALARLVAALEEGTR